MRLMRDSPALFIDLYELTMAQAYFTKEMRETAYFEVTVRRLAEELSRLPEDVKAITNPAEYPVIFI